MEITAQDFLAAPTLAPWLTERLGSGVFSTVYATPDPSKVIKVGKSLKEDSWPFFAVWSMSRERGPHILKVHALRIEGDGFAALTERLDMTLASAIVVARLDPLRAELLKELRAFASAFGYYHAASVEAAWPDLRPVLRTLAEDMAQYSRDLHDENIMLREDGTPVVIDPVSYRSAGRDALIAALSPYQNTRIVA